MKTKLKMIRSFNKWRNKKFSERVSAPVTTKSVTWIMSATFVKMAVLIFFGALILFPFYYMISTSLMTEAEATNKTDTILAPSSAKWGNYTDALNGGTTGGYWQAILYSFIIAAITVTIKIFVTMLLGYAFAYKNYRFKRALWLFFLSMLMLPEVALMSGQYQIIVRLNWHHGTNIILGLFIPFVASVFNAMMFKNAFEAIPERTKEATMVDGASELTYFVKVAVPMIKPTTITVLILTAFASWNSYMWPALLLQGKDIQTIPTWVFLTGREDGGDNKMIIPIRMAGTVLAITPMFLAYFIFKKRIMSAISRQGSAIKG